MRWGTGKNCGVPDKVLFLDPGSSYKAVIYRATKSLSYITVCVVFYIYVYFTIKRLKFSISNYSRSDVMTKRSEMIVITGINMAFENILSF